jgi:hypothetical protein
MGEFPQRAQMHICECFVVGRKFSSRVIRITVSESDLLQYPTILYHPWQTRQHGDVHTMNRDLRAVANDTSLTDLSRQHVALFGRATPSTGELRRLAVSREHLV